MNTDSWRLAKINYAESFYVILLARFIFTGYKFEAFYHNSGPALATLHDFPLMAGHRSFRGCRMNQHGLRAIGLLAGYPPLESVNPLLLVESASQVNPSEPFQEDRQHRFFRSAGQEYRDHR